MNDNHTSTFRASDFKASNFKASNFRNGRTALIGIHHLRLVWSAQLCLVETRLSPWERLHDRLLWLGFIAWLRHDAQSETRNAEKQQQEKQQEERRQGETWSDGSAA